MAGIMKHQGRISTSYTSPDMDTGVCVVRPNYTMIKKNWIPAFAGMTGVAGLKAQFEQGRVKPFICPVLSCAFSFVDADCPCGGTVTVALPLHAKRYQLMSKINEAVNNRQNQATPGGQARELVPHYCMVGQG